MRGTRDRQYVVSPICRNVDFAAKWEKLNPKEHYQNAKERHNMEIIVYLGMDVHKDTYSVCCYDPRSNKYFYESKMKAASRNVIKYIGKVREQIGDVTFLCGYEAGPTGFGLYRDLGKAGIACVVMAPTSLKKAPGSKVKNDRVDARFLAKALFTRDYSQVHVSTKNEEAVREFCRMRHSLAGDLKKARQVLLSFLLRQGRKYDGTRYWTKAHREWLKKQEFDEEYQKEAFDEYMISVNSLEFRLHGIENRLEEIAGDGEVKEKVEKLVCFCGIDTLTAISIVSEVGDFSRFSRAWDFSNFVGLTVGERSSGCRERHTGITKSGNVYLRKLLTESAKSIKRSNARGEKSKRLRMRQEGQRPEVIAYADKCRLRLKRKMQHLEMKGKAANVASTAGARELACFVWGMMTGHTA